MLPLIPCPWSQFFKAETYRSAHSRSVFDTNIIRTNNPGVIVRATNSIGGKMRIALQLHCHFLWSLCSEGSEVVLGFKWSGRRGWGALILQEFTFSPRRLSPVIWVRLYLHWGTTSVKEHKHSPRPCSLQMFPAWCDPHSAEHWHRPSAEWSSALTKGMAGRGRVALAQGHDSIHCGVQPHSCAWHSTGAGGTTVVTGEGEV